MTKENISLQSWQLFFFFSLLYAAHKENLINLIYITQPPYNPSSTQILIPLELGILAPVGEIRRSLWWTSDVVHYSTKRQLSV